MTLRPFGAAVLACALALAGTAAEARPHHKPAHARALAADHCVSNDSGRVICRAGETRMGGSQTGARGRTKVVDANGNGGVRIIPHPAGCPWRLFCGCGLARYWRLDNVRRLSLVSNWPKIFPRAHGPAVGLAAVKSTLHHVKGIIGGGPDAWLVVDFNSGGHLSRIYVTADFSGYFFVDPSARMASR